MRIDFHFNLSLYLPQCFPDYGSKPLGASIISMLDSTVFEKQTILVEHDSSFVPGSLSIYPIMTCSSPYY